MRQNAKSSSACWPRAAPGGWPPDASAARPPPSIAPRCATSSSPSNWAAENAAKLNFANRINAAAAEPRFWRAAAWWLERRSADDFALLSPKTVTFEQAGKMFVYLMEYIGLDMADDKIDMALERMDELIDELQEDANALAAPAPTPQAPPDETRWIDGPPLSSGEQDLSAIDPSDDV